MPSFYGIFFLTQEAYKLRHDARLFPRGLSFKVLLRAHLHELAKTEITLLIVNPCDGHTSQAPVIVKQLPKTKVTTCAMASLRHLVAIAASASTVGALWTNGSVIAPCDSPIYCHGDILEEIQLAHPFEDSKTFVDM